MKHFYRLMLLSFLGLVALAHFTQAQNSIIISQYIETSSGSTPKGIELWNVSGSTIDFSVTNLEIFKGTNGGALSLDHTVSTGTLGAGEVMVVGTSDMGTYLTTEGLTTVLYSEKSFTFNGDDALSVVLDGNTEDVFGTAGDDPGSAWSGNGVETRNNNIGLKTGISTGDTDGWTDPSERFENVAGGTDLTGFGLAPVADNTAPSFEVGFPAVSNINATGFEIDVQLDEAGTFYYVVVADGSGTPTAAAVQGGTATGQVASGSQAVSDAATTATASVTGLTTSTTYDVYVVAEDASGNLQADGDVVELADVTPVADVNPPTLSGAATDAGAAQSITLTFDEVVTTTDATGFSVEINAAAATVSGISGSGSDELILSISEEIFVGDVVTVSYDDTQGDVADGASNAFASVSDQAVTNNATVNLVANIAAARALSGGDIVRISGEIIVTHVSGNSRDQIFVEDASAGILIDDSAPVIPPGTLVLGDGITNFEGTLGSFSGVTQIVPTGIPSEITNGNAISTSTVTIDVFNADVDSYESELLLIEEVTFTNADGSTTFTEPSNDYSTISDGVNTTTFDADGFLGADYTGDVIPYGRVDLIVLGRENNGTPIVTSRTAADIQDNYAPLFTVAPAASNETIQGADITFQADEEGTFYYYVLADGASAPSVSDVITNGVSTAYTDVASDVSVTITGLADNTPFDVYVVAADDETVPNEQDAPTLVEFTTVEITFDATTDITPLASPIAQTDISSLNDSDVEAVDVFGFTLSDEGTDGVSTFVDAIVIEAGSNNTADWVSTIDGATLSDGTTDYSMTIAADQLTLDLSGSEYELANGADQEFTLSIWLETDVTDEDVLEFEVPITHLFTATPAGSVFANPISSAVTSAQHTVDVTATEIEIDANTSVAVAEDFTLTATAVDENGNVDIAARNVSISKTSGSGDLSGTGLTGQAMTEGVFEWTDLELSAADSYVLTVDDDGSAVTGTIALEATVGTAGPAKLLVTEIVVTPTDGEFIEIVNTESETVFLENFYVTDATSGSNSYYNIVTGADFGDGNASSSDFHVRFPDGSSIEPGEVQTIALAGSDGFFAEYGVNPTYELTEDGASPDAIPDMVEVVAGSVGSSAGLSNAGEIVILYHWDGSSDLVTDIDYVVWGDKAEAVDKTGVSVDGPDVDEISSTYLNDTPIANQAIVLDDSHEFGFSWQRIDISEGSELTSGGNGVNGEDETSEDLNLTFIQDEPTPGVFEFEMEGDPIITIDDTGFDSNFGTFILPEEGVDVAAEVRTYSVSAVDMLGDVTITAPAGYEISSDGSTFSSTVTLTPDGEGTVTSTEISVTFSPTVEGTFNGEIAHTSTDALTKSLDVAGVAVPSNTLFFENFSNCEALNVFETQSVIGDEVWECTSNGFDGSGARISGFASGSQDNEDWLVSPAIDLTSVTSADLSFTSDGSFSGPLLEVLVSIDYAGDVTTATWTALTVALDTDLDNFDTWTPSGDISLGSFAGENINIAFKYTSNPTDGSTTWTIDDVLVTETQPFFTVDDAGFTSDFQTQDVGTSSVATSFTVEGFGLTEDVTVTPPAQFEVATSSEFTSPGTNASPLTITVTDGTVDQEVFVRFSPSAAGSFTGNVVVETAGFDDVTLSVSGVGDEDDEEPALGLDDQSSLVVYPNPIQEVFEINNQTGKEIFVQVFALDGSIMSVTKRDNGYDISSLRSGVYVLVIKDENDTELSRQQIIKQ